MHDFVLGLGSSLGSREALVRIAARLIEASPRIHAPALSSRYVTAPIGPSPHDFVNAALRVRTALSPRELLELALAVERSLGRVRRERWGARTIDVDLLWWEGGSVGEPELCLPHPRLRERAFALAPLLEVAPELDAELGPALRAVGGAPPRAPWTQVRIEDDRVEVRALDDADALALALDAALGGGAGTPEPLEAADPAALVEAACAAGASSVAIEAFEPGAVRARVVRDPARPCATTAWDLSELREGRCVLRARSGPSSRARYGALGAA